MAVHEIAGKAKGSSRASGTLRGRSKFGAKDANMPILSRLVQLNAQDRDEVREYAQQLVANLEASMGDDGHLLRGYRPPTYGFANETLTEFAEIADLTHRLLNGIIDDNIQPSDLGELNDKRNKDQPQKVLRGITNAQGSVPVATITEEIFYSPPRDLLHARLPDIVQDLAHVVAKSPERVRKCEECGNPFVLLREQTGTRFCSRRCGDRRFAREKLHRKNLHNSGALMHGTVDMPPNNML